MPSMPGGVTSSSAASMISSVMLVKMPVTRALCRSSLRAVRRPIRPPSTALLTVSDVLLATSDFSLASSCHRLANAISALSGSGRCWPCPRRR